MNVYPLPALGVSALILAASFVPSRAALLVYEGFDYTTGSTLNTITPNASTVGLDKTTAYSGSGVGKYTVQSGLTFGSLTTTGGSIKSTSESSSAPAVGGAKLSLNSYVGTLWSSYLVSFSSTSNADRTYGALSRVSNDIANNGERFNAYADARYPSSSTSAPTTNLGISYNAANNVTVGTTSLLSGTTYIIISKFTNVGSQIPAGTGTATLYALSLSQFSNFINSGGAESYLNAATIGTGSSDVTGRVSNTNSGTSTYLFQSGAYAQFVNVGDSATFDELRYGSTLTDVVPVPEPGTLALVAAGVLGLFVSRRSWRKNKR